jgi:hypothetical protein
MNLGARTLAAFLGCLAVLRGTSLLGHNVMFPFGNILLDCGSTLT